MGELKLLRGQALAMQWVGYALQRMTADIKNGGRVTDQLLGNAKSVGNSNGLHTLAAGSNHVVNFVLPFALEVALKALIVKRVGNPKRTHNLVLLFGMLPLETKEELRKEYIAQKKIGGIADGKSFEQLLEIHKNDFIDWRYLESAERLKKEDREIQIAISAALKVFENKV